MQTDWETNGQKYKQAHRKANKQRQKETSIQKSPLTLEDTITNEKWQLKECANCRTNWICVWNPPPPPLTLYISVYTYIEDKVLYTLNLLKRNKLKSLDFIKAHWIQLLTSSSFYWKYIYWIFDIAEYNLKKFNFLHSLLLYLTNIDKIYQIMPIFLAMD